LIGKIQNLKTLNLYAIKIDALPYGVNNYYENNGNSLECTTGRLDFKHFLEHGLRPPKTDVQNNHKWPRHAPGANRTTTPTLILTVDLKQQITESMETSKQEVMANVQVSHRICNRSYYLSFFLSFYRYCTRSSYEHNGRIGGGNTLRP